jgi:hypothetical protein
MAPLKPLGLAILGLLLAAGAPSGSFALAQTTTAQANPAATAALGLKPAQPGQSVAAGQLAAAKSPAAVPVPSIATPSKPLWQELTAQQQQSLKPLGANWATFSEAHKRKWLALSKNYPTLAPSEQAKLHSRMTEWASMSPQQRNQARLNFAETKKMAPDEKTANWQAYQALSPEEKQKLAAKAPPAQTGATAAVKPVPAQKLANVPTTRNSQKSPTVAANAPDIHTNTLLPRNSGGNEPALGKN